MQYKTNQLDKLVLFSNENYQNISQDFWVYKFTTVNPSYQYSLIDDLKQDLPDVKSTVYLQGKAFYALFEKVKFKNEFELEDKIKLVISGSEEVQFFQITNLRDENEIDKRHLAQLLFNSLASNSLRNAKYSNITGGLYWVVKAVEAKEKENTAKITWQYIALKLALDYHLHLKLEVKTFSNLKMTGKMNFANRKMQFKDYVQYEISSDSIRSMRRLKSNEYNKKFETTYILAQADGRKSTVSFLDFSDWNNFETSKCGVLYLFLKEIREQISQYITIKFVELPFSQEKTEFDKDLSARVKERIKAFYQNKPIVINIAESLKDDQDANKLAENLQTFLTDQEREYKIQNVSIGSLSENALNIRVIRNKQFYEDNSLSDEYCKDKNYLVHHITTDDFDIKLEKTKKDESKKLLSSPAIDVVLKESYIKNDIRQGKITILDWTFGEWLFIGKAEAEADTDSKEKKYNFNLLRVLANGSLEFTICLHEQTFENSDYEKLKSIYQSYDKFNGREFLTCLLVSDHQNINLIFETPRFTIQEIERIGETLELEYQDDDKYLRKNVVVQIINNFLKSQHFQEKDKDSLEKLVQLLENYKSSFSKKDLLDLFKKDKANLSNKGENHLQGRFCKFYHKQTGDILKSFFRGKTDKKELLGSRLDIFYEINESKTEAFYFVGESSNNPNNPINSKFQNATNIRKIKAVGNLKRQQSQLVFDQLLQTMAVDFVKQGNLTVLPFPFKYLREIIK